MRTAAAPLLLGMLALLGTPGPVSAQRTQPAERPLRGLFQTGGQSAMGLTFASYGGLDEATVRTTGPNRDDRRVTDGEYMGGTLGLNLLRPLGRGRMQASGSSDLRYYPGTAIFGASRPTRPRPA